MLTDSIALEKSSEYLIASGIFDIPGSKVDLVGNDSKKLSEAQVSEMLRRFSSGDWGAVSEEYRDENDKYLKSSDNPDWAFVGRYLVDGTDYRVYAGIKHGEAEMLQIISKNDDITLLGKDMMEPTKTWQREQVRISQPNPIE